MESGADTGVVSKHVWAIKTIKWYTYSAQEFSDDAPIEEDLRTANVMYMYDDLKVEDIIISWVIHQIYFVFNTSDSLSCPNQMCLYGLYIDK